MSTNRYEYQPKKVIVCGHSKIGHSQDAHEYDSILEARMAVLLIQNKIRFTPHVKFLGLVDKEGKEFTYTVDFLFERPQKFGLMCQWAMAIEVKGVLSYNDIRRCDALAYWKNVPVYIATPAYIELWEKEGLMKPMRVAKIQLPQRQKEETDNVV